MDASQLEIVNSWIRDSSSKFEEAARNVVTRILNISETQTDIGSEGMVRWRQIVTALFTTTDSVLPEYTKEAVMEQFADASPEIKDAIRKLVVGIIEENLDDILDHIRRSIATENNNPN